MHAHGHVFASSSSSSSPRRLLRRSGVYKQLGSRSRERSTPDRSARWLANRVIRATSSDWPVSWLTGRPAAMTVGPASAQERFNLWRSAKQAAAAARAATLTQNPRRVEPRTGPIKQSSASEEPAKERERERARLQITAQVSAEAHSSAHLCDCLLSRSRTGLHRLGRRLHRPPLIGLKRTGALGIFLSVSSYSVPY